jgi:hypothetical protein
MSSNKLLLENFTYVLGLGSGNAARSYLLMIMLIHQNDKSHVDDMKLEEVL